MPGGARRRRAGGPCQHDRAGRPVLLSAGNLIPADGLVLEAQDFLVSEASMTGEFVPGREAPGDRPAGRADRGPDQLRSFSALRCAAARRRSSPSRRAAGPSSAPIAARLRARQPETDFARGVRQFGYLLIRVMVVIVLFVLTANLLLAPPGDRVRCSSPWRWPSACRRNCCRRSSASRSPPAPGR